VLFRGTAIVSALTLLSRIAGFGRDLLVAKLLGASIFADAFFVAFRIPNLLRSLVAEGALTSAFTPVFSTALADNRERAKATFRRVSGFLLLTTSLLTLLIIGFAPQVVELLAPGFAASQEKLSLCITLTRIMAPYIACVSVIAMLNAALNTLGIFGASAWAQVTMNIVLIIGAIIAMPFDLSTATVILSISVLVGGVVQILAQIPACKRGGLPLLPSFRIISRDVADVVKLMIPATVGASVYQITIFVGTLLASLLPTGSVSWLFYADRVAQFPIGIFSIALASVLLPALANASANADTKTFHRNLSDSLRFTNFCIIPMAVGIWALALPITRLLFERGAFSYDSALKTSYALQALSVGLWASSCHSMLVRAFIARKDTITPTIIGVCSLALNLCASLLLMGPIARGELDGVFVKAMVNLQTSLLYLLPVGLSLGHVGLALASSIAAMGSLLLVATLFCFSIGNFPARSFLISTIKSSVSAIIMLNVIQLSSGQFTAPFAACAIGIPTGVLVYFLASYLLRSQELFDAIAVLRRRLVKQ
jgi:putative peptidoglycan lipid II flippase